MRLAFDPQFEVGALAFRWQAVGLAVIFLLALAWWWRSLRGARPGIRPDDLLFVVLGIVPGALVGGRLMHGLVFSEAYLARPEVILDLSRGSLSLTGAVLGGLISGGYVSRLLGHSVRVWCHAASGPLLLAIGLGKLSLLLSGGGQGVPFDGPWAISYSGPGPWLAADASAAAHPSQAYEGLWTLAGLVLAAGARPILRRRVGPRVGVGVGAGSEVGGTFLVALAWWLAGRFLAGFTWREDALVGALRAEQLIALLGGSVIVAALWLRRRPKVTGR